MAEPLPPIKIVCDLAEAASGIPDFLRAIPTVTLEMVRLDVGDYLIYSGERTFAIERKTARDFCASLSADGRLMPQVKMLTAQFERVFMLIEGGSIYETSFGIQLQALHGAMSWLTVLEGVAPVYSRSPRESAELIATMARHASQGLGYEIPLRTAKPKLTQVMQQYLMEGLPGIGPGKALALLRKFGTPAAVFSASEADIASVPGIGPKSAAKVVNVLRTRWEGSADEVP